LKFSLQQSIGHASALYSHITLTLKSLHCLKINERIKYRFSLSHINLSKLVSLLTSALFFHSLHIVVLGLPLLSPLFALSLTSRLKISNRSYYYSALLFVLGTRVFDFGSRLKEILRLYERFIEGRLDTS